MSDVDWARRCLSPLWTHGPQTRMGRGPGSRVTWLCITYSDRPAIDAPAAAAARLGRRQAGPWGGPRRSAVCRGARDAVRPRRAGRYRLCPGRRDGAADRRRRTRPAVRRRRCGPGSGDRAAQDGRAHAFSRIFLELAAATAAIVRLLDDELPEGFEGFDRIVVDEVQDLAVLETSVGRRAVPGGRAPVGTRAVAAVPGDDGQTVRPSGFDWGPLNDRPAGRTPRRPAPVPPPGQLALPESHRGGHRPRVGLLRPPRLEMARLPMKPRHQQGGHHVDTHLHHVVANVPTAVGLLERVSSAMPCSAP